MAGTLVAILVLSLLAPRFRVWLAARRRRRFEAGESVRIPVRLRGGTAPYPRRWRWGSVRSGDDPLVFRAWHRATPPVPLTGLTVVRTAIDTEVDSTEPVVVLGLRDSSGTRVDLGVAESHAELAESVLRAHRAGPAPARRERRMPVWRAALAGLAVLWALAWLYLVGAGDIRQARVVENDGEDFCRVEWVAGGRTENTWVDCTDQVPGEPLGIVALPAPFRGEAVDQPSTAFFVSLLFVVGVTPAALVLLGRARSRGRPVAPVPASAAVVGDAEAPRLGDEGEVTFARVAEVVRRRADVEGWDQSRTRHPRLRRGLRWAWRALWPLVPVFFAALAGATSVTIALRGEAALTRTATATVDVVDSYFPFVPDDVVVVYDAGGREVTARVAAVKTYDVGDRVDVRYDPARPSHARLSGSADGTGRGVAIAVLVGGAGLVLLVWRSAVVARVLVTYRRRRRQPGTPIRYAVTRDGVDDVVMLLFDAYGDGPPLGAVLLDDTPPDAPVAGDALAHGRVAEGERVVVAIGKHLVHPDSPVLPAEPDEVLAAVNGEPLFLDEEPPASLEL